MYVLVFTLLAAFTVVTPVFADEGGPTAEQVNDLTLGLNIFWMILGGFMVFFMQAGFAFLGAGLIRAKNTVNYLTKSFMDFCMCTLSFWAFGFALMFGGSALAYGL
ncbi:MAG: ammonium transporter, partial [Chloroflexi bacterium]|nr:ammonium transporter [Chloroflexota bacterium]